MAEDVLGAVVVTVAVAMAMAGEAVDKTSIWHPKTSFLPFQVNTGSV